jgi:hypothetical protein
VDVWIIFRVDVLQSQQAAWLGDVFGSSPAWAQGHQVIQIGLSWIYLTGASIRSNVYLLTSFRRQNDPLPVSRRGVGGLLGSCIERVREAGGRSMEQFVHLARMEVHE